MPNLCDISSCLIWPLGVSLAFRVPYSHFVCYTAHWRFPIAASMQPMHLKVGVSDMIRVSQLFFHASIISLSALQVLRWKFGPRVYILYVAPPLICAHNACCIYSRVPHPKFPCSTNLAILQVARFIFGFSTYA